MVSFASLNTALTGLRYHQLGMDVASANVANVATEGYTRRRIEGESVGAPAQPALWSRYDGAGDGVRVAGVTRMADAFLDARARLEHGKQSHLDVRRTVLERLESGIGEPGDNGVAAAMAELRTGWGDVANNPGSDAARSQLIARAEGLADAFGIQARNVSTEIEGQQTRAESVVVEVNTLLADLAATNRSVATAKLNGTDAGTLLDNRDQLTMRLAELTGASGTPNARGQMTVTLGGVELVSGQEHGSFALDTSTTPVLISLTDAGGAPHTLDRGSLGGEAGGVVELLDVTLPGYLSGLDAVAEDLAAEVNAQHERGYDATGTPGAVVFTYTPGAAAGTLRVALTSPDQVAASAIAGPANLDGENALVLGGLKGAESAYQRLVNGFGTEVASVNRLAANQRVLTDQVDGSRDQLAGVSTDEEMLAMLAHQRGYEAASRVITVIDSVLDTLINRTGLLR